MKTEPRPASAPLPSGTPRWLVPALLAAVLLAAAGLRLPRLDSVPPGAWIDEAIQGLQGEALVEGTKLQATSHVGFQPMPEWLVPEAVAIRLGGNSLGVLRLPAVLAALLAVGLAFLAGRAIAGPAAGLGAAAFLAGSFWHVQYSRLALPCVFVVTEGLAVGWLLLSPKAPGPWAGAALGVLCLVAPYGYAASLITPVTVAVLLAIRWRGAPEARPGRGFLVLVAAGALLLAAGMVWWRPQGLLRTAELASENRDPLLGQLWGWLKSVLWSTEPGLYYWRHYPTGAPRFTPVELGFVLAGVAVLWRSAAFARWQKWGWTAWAITCAVPEWFGSEAPHLSRGLPQLAPAAVAAGLAAGALAGRWRTWGAAAVGVLLALNTGWTARTLYVRFAHDPMVAAWYLAPNRAAAEAILAVSAKEPVALSGRVEYARDPVLLYFLSSAVRRGEIVVTAEEPKVLYPVTVVSDAASKQPAFVLFDGRKPYQGRRHLALWFVNELLMIPETAVTAHRLPEALRDYRWLMTVIPQSMGVRAGLGLTLVMMGHPREGLPHLEYALSCNPEGRAREIILQAVEAARKAAPAGPRVL